MATNQNAGDARRAIAKPTKCKGAPTAIKMPAHRGKTFDLATAMPKITKPVMKPTAANPLKTTTGGYTLMASIVAGASAARTGAKKPNMLDMASRAVPAKATKNPINPGRPIRCDAAT